MHNFDLLALRKLQIIRKFRNIYLSLFSSMARDAILTRENLSFLTNIHGRHFSRFPVIFRLILVLVHRNIVPIRFDYNLSLCSLCYMINVTI